ncbi:MAG: hypothetical protein VX737_05570 [Pseudomonadota bacterium]|nr:hypothetical protein [Pseudomonadota bacterium]
MKVLVSIENKCTLIDTEIVDLIQIEIPNARKAPETKPNESNLAKMTDILKNTTERLAKVYAYNRIKELKKFTRTSTDKETRALFLKCRYQIEILKDRNPEKYEQIEKKINDIMSMIIHVKNSPGADAYVITSTSPQWGSHFCKTLFEAIHQSLDAEIKKTSNDGFIVTMGSEKHTLEETFETFKSSWYEPAMQSQFWDPMLNTSSKMGSFLSELASASLHVSLMFLPRRRGPAEEALRKFSHYQNKSFQRPTASSADDKKNHDDEQINNPSPQ